MRDDVTPPIGVLNVARLTAAQVLSASVGWNQTVDDWRVFFQSGAVFGAVREEGVKSAESQEGELLATAATLPYGHDFAFISMVIVVAAMRGQGLGTRMLKHCIATLRAAGRVAVLDATPAGEAIYRPLGFVPWFGLERWDGRGGAACPSDEAPATIIAGPALDAAQRTALITRDAASFGASRSALIDAFVARPDTKIVRSVDGDGIAIVRAGRVASHIGPIAATNEASALVLLEAALNATTGRIFIDVPTRWRGLAARLRARGFAVQRPFLRMALGRENAYGASDELFAAAGPEFG